MTANVDSISRVVLVTHSYVKLHLLPENSKYVKMKTKAVKNTVSPNFEETVQVYAVCLFYFECSFT